MKLALRRISQTSKVYNAYINAEIHVEQKGFIGYTAIYRKSHNGSNLTSHKYVPLDTNMNMHAMPDDHITMSGL